MRAAAIFLVLLLAGCGDGGGLNGNGSASANQIERLSTPGEEKADPRASVRLEPLAPADLDRAGMAAPACDFSRDGLILLAATPGDAIARIGGRLLHFTHASPMGATGGFFEDRRMSISVGRTAQTEADAGRWPARLTVTNRRSEVQAERDGVWRCRP